MTYKIGETSLFRSVRMRPAQDCARAFVHGKRRRIAGLTRTTQVRDMTQVMHCTCEGLCVQYPARSVDGRTPGTILAGRILTDLNQQGFPIL